MNRLRIVTSVIFATSLGFILGGCSTSPQNVSMAQKQNNPLQQSSSTNSSIEKTALPVGYYCFTINGNVIEMDNTVRLLQKNGIIQEKMSSPLCGIITWKNNLVSSGNNVGYTKLVPVGKETYFGKYEYYGIALYKDVFYEDFPVGVILRKLHAEISCYNGRYQIYEKCYPEHTANRAMPND